MAKTSEITVRARQRSAPATARPVRHPEVTHLLDSEGVHHRVYTVTCGTCLQQYRALGDHDGVYDVTRQPKPHVCGDER